MEIWQEEFLNNMQNYIDELNSCLDERIKNFQDNVKYIQSTIENLDNISIVLQLSVIDVIGAASERIKAILEGMGKKDNERKDQSG